MKNNYKKGSLALNKILDIIKEDPITNTEVYNEYALKHNLKRTRYVAIATILLIFISYYNLLVNKYSYNKIYLISITILLLISSINILFSKIFETWLLKNSNYAKLLIISLWCFSILIDTPTFVRDAGRTFQALNLTTWLAGMVILIVLKRRNILYVFISFLIYNLIIAYYSSAPPEFYGSIISRVFVAALISYFLLYPYNINTVKNLVNSRVDYLTLLYNRGEGLKKIIKLLEARKDSECYTAFYMMDIDNFKKFNDSYGHQAGDSALEIVSECIKNTFSRKEDINIRYGGEEFLTCINTDSPEIIKKLAERLHKNLKKSISDIDDKKYYNLTISLGYFILAPDKQNKHNIKELIHYADIALYKAKSSGKNCSVNFSDI